MFEDEYIDIYLKLKKKTNFFLLSDSVKTEDLINLSIINNKFVKINIWTSFANSKNISNNLLKEKNINLEIFEDLNLEKILLKKENQLGNIFFEFGGKIFKNHLENNIKYFDLLIITILNDNSLDEKYLTKTKFNQKDIFKTYKNILEKNPILWKDKIWQFQTFNHIKK